MPDQPAASDVTPDAAGPHIDGGDVTRGVSSVRQNYSAPTFVRAPKRLIAIVTCLRCGAAVLPFGDIDAMTLHDGWHAVQEARARHSHDRRPA